MAENALVPAQMLDVEQKLNSLVGRLEKDPVMQGSLLFLVKLWMDIAKRLSKHFEKARINISYGKQTLMSRKRPLEDDVMYLKGEVEKFEIQLGDLRAEIYKAQRENHILVERSRARRSEHDSKVESIGIEIKTIKREMDCLNERITNFEQQAIDSDVYALRYKKKAQSAKQRSIFHVAVGNVISGTALVSGAALAPFTGGSSAVAAGAVVAAVSAGVNGTVAAVKYHEASNADKRSCDHKENAQRLRADVRKCDRQIKEKQVDIKRRKSQSKELEEICVTLLEVEDMIYVFVEVVNQVNAKITGFKVLMQKAVQSGDALRIMPAALGRKEEKRKGFAKLFRRKPKKLSGESLNLMEQVKYEWQDVVSYMSLGDSAQSQGLLQISEHAHQ